MPHFHFKNSFYYKTDIKKIFFESLDIEAGGHFGSVR